MSDQFILDEGNQFILFDTSSGDIQTSFQAPNLNTFIKVVLTLKKLEDGSTVDVSFTNREILGTAISWPLLRRIDTLGAKMGLYLPEASRSSFVLDNSPGSFGSERRFSDLLDRYTIIEQPAIIYVAQIPLGKETIVDGDFTEIWRSVVTEWAISNDQLKINIARSLIPVRLATYVISRDTFPDAPADSLGKQLPIIFSSSGEFIEVEAVRTSGVVDDGTLNTVEYAYATKFRTQYQNGSKKVLLENDKKEWQEITFVADATVPLLSFPPVAGSFKTAWGAVKEYGYGLLAGQNVTGGEVIVGADWYLASTTFGVGVPSGTYTYTCKIYNSNNGYPGDLLASDTLSNGSSRIVYDSTVGGGTVSVFKFEFNFNKPVMVPALSDATNNALFITLSRSDTSDLFSLVQEGSGGGSLPAFEKYRLLDTTAGTDQNFVKEVYTSNREHFKIFALSSGASTAPVLGDAMQNGLTHSSFRIEMRDQNNLPDLSKLRLIVKSEGLKDSVISIITGTPFAPLDNPLYQIRLLMMEAGTGGFWNEVTFDASKFSSTYAAAFGSSSRWKIKTSGASQGRTRVRDIIEDICRNSGCRLVPFVSGTAKVVGLYAEGTNIPTSFIIDDEQAKLISYEIGGVDTIINKIQMVFNRTIRSNTESLLAQGGLNNYQSTVDSEVDSLDVPYADIDRSIATWGERLLDSISFPWITLTQTAKSVGALILRKWNKPQRIITLEVPYNKYSTIELMQTGIVKMTGLPDYYGTSLDARTVTAGTGTDPTDLIKGHYWKRYKSYRVQVEGNDIVFSATEPIKRVLTLNVLEDINIT